MKISAVITTVNHKHKQPMAMKVCDSLTSTGFIFDEKIVSIDYINSDKYDEDIASYFEHHNWKIKKSLYGSRIDTLIDLMRYFVENNTDFVLHAEDDILVDYLPTRNDLEGLLLLAKNNQTCGQLTLSLGGSTFKCEGGDDGDLYDIENEKIFENEKILIFRRKEENASSFFFELGTMFIRPKIMLMCLEYAKKNFSNMQIEQAQTRAWFDLNIPSIFYRATLCKPQVQKYWKNDTWKVDGECRFITILDPNQGASLYGGKHSV